MPSPRSPRVAPLAALALAVALCLAFPRGSSAQRPIPPPTTGNQPWLVVLCRASDVSYPQADPVAWFTRLLGNAAPGFGDYFREVSYGAMTIDGSRAVGVYTLPGPATSYFEQRGQTWFIRQGVGEQCLAAADPAVNFPDYTGILLFFPGRPEWGGFVASTGGSAELSLDGQRKRYGYAELSVDTPAGSYVAHEWHHALGLLHSGGPYGSNYDSVWDAVSGARFAGPCPILDPVYRCPGQHTIAYHKSRLGWIPAERILTVLPGEVKRVRLHQLATMPTGPDEYLMVKVPYWSYGEFGFGLFSLEARRQVGYDRVLPGNAVIVHTVEDYFYSDGTTQVVDVDNNGNPSDAGAMWTPGETLVYTRGGVTLVMCVEAERADGFSVTVAANADACGVTFQRVFLPLVRGR
jgi:M6 family metalloprotease-like protein